MQHYSNKITITGDLGSGKSSVGNLVAHQLGFAITSVGMIQREIAARYQLSTLELNRLSEVNPDIDREIDAVYASIQQSAEGYVIDARLGWHFVPSSLKIYLQTDPAIAAQRIFADPTRLNEKYTDIHQALAALRDRKDSENRRFLREYHIDCSDLSHFDVLIDTSYASQQTAADLITYLYQRYQQGLSNHKQWISPRHLLPGTEIPGTASTALDHLKPLQVTKNQNYYHIFGDHQTTAQAALIPVELVN